VIPMRSIAVLLTLLLIRHTALADSATVIVTTSGKIAERDRTLAMDAAQNRLRAAGWEFTGNPLTSREVEVVTNCLHNVEAWPCVSKVVAARGIRRVAAVALKRDQTLSGTPELVITVRLVLADVELVVLGRRFCEQCTDDTLSELTTELITELLQQAALDAGRTVLSIKSTPQGSIYTVDGVLKSATDAIITVVPGTHVVTIEHDGYQTETRTIDAVEGKTAEVMVTLRRLDPLGSPSGSVERIHEFQPRSRALPITLVAVGSAAALGGMIALPFNQRDDRKPPTERQPQWRYDTVTPGIAFIVGGVAAASVGAYIWWKYSRDDTHPAATVIPVAGGAVVGVGGVF
jgi:hypothetical protein